MFKTVQKALSSVFSRQAEPQAKAEAPATATNEAPAQASTQTSSFRHSTNWRDYPMAG